MSVIATTLALGSLVVSSPPSSPSTVSLPEVLAGAVRVLSRSIDTYHCAPRARVGVPTRGALEARPAALGRYLESKLSRYWDAEIPVRPHAIVSGLYSGIEPVSCRHYAGVGEAWALVRIRLPSGLRFLDVREDGRGAAPRPRFPPKVQARIEAVGCDARTPATLVVGLESRPCRRLALAALRQMGVEAILADFPARAFDRCPGSGNGVFILLDPARTGLGDAVLFTAELPGDDPVSDERRQIRALHVRARAEGSIRSAPWPELPEPESEWHTEPWMDRHLWGCGASPAEAVAPQPSPPGGGDHVAEGSTPEGIQVEP